MAGGGKQRACTHIAPFVLGFLSQISKCFERLMGFSRTVLQFVQVKRSVIFFVVFAFLWKTGLVWPPNPACLLSYRRLPCATSEALPALYWVTLKTWWLRHLGALQKVFVVFGAFTMAKLRARRESGE